MEIERFWQVVESARQTGGEDPDARVDALRSELSGMVPAELQSFQNHYDQLIGRAYRWDLWGAAYVINGGCSDDGFRYFRDWLISEGRETYEAALLDPESLAALPKVGLAENELYGYVALELFEEAGAGEFDRDFSTEGADPVGEPWEEDAVYAMFPRLAEKYQQ
jgi:hypothetical protein